MLSFSRAGSGNLMGESELADEVKAELLTGPGMFSSSGREDGTLFHSRVLWKSLSCIFIPFHTWSKYYRLRVRKVFQMSTCRPVSRMTGRKVMQNTYRRLKMLNSHIVEHSHFSLSVQNMSARTALVNLDSSTH